MPNSPNADLYLILSEQIEGQVQLIAEGHGTLNETLESLRHEMNQRFESMEKRFDRLEIKVDRNTLDICELRILLP